MVMAANGSYPWLHYWAGRNPGCVGHLYSPGGQRGPYPWLPYALDNGCFNGFDKAAWLELLEWASIQRQKPMWITVPDVVADHDATLELWNRWSPTAAKYNRPLAFVVQDGCTPDAVPSQAEVVFVGGSTAWKLRTLPIWASHFERVHVGRVNGAKRLFYCYRNQVESCDGTGWGRGNQSQLKGLIQYLETIEGTRAEPDQGDLCLM